MNTKSPSEEFMDYTESIKRENRYFVDPKYLNYFDKYFESNIINIPETHKLYRSRLNDARIGSKAYEDEEIGMPKKEIITNNGRANPIGINYFYLSSDAMTSISEVRPSIEDNITVATIELTKTLNFVDLKDIVTVEGGITDKEIEEINRVMYFMLNMVRGFKKPIKGEPGLEYPPFQYFAEYCKIKGFDGIRFLSSVMNQYKDGETESDYHYNYVLFKDEHTKIIEKIVFEIKAIEYVIFKA